MSWKCLECGSKSSRLIKTCRRCKSTDIDIDSDATLPMPSAASAKRKPKKDPLAVSEETRKAREAVQAIEHEPESCTPEMLKVMEACNERDDKAANESDSLAKIRIKVDADAFRLAEFMQEVEMHHRREVADYSRKMLVRGVLADVPEGKSFRYGTVIRQVPGMVTVEFTDGERTTISPHAEVESGSAVDVIVQKGAKPTQEERATRVVAPRESKEVDAFGSRLGSVRAIFNATLTKEPKTAAAMHKELKEEYTPGRIRSYMEDLTLRVPDKVGMSELGFFLK